MKKKRIQKRNRKEISLPFVCAAHFAAIGHLRPGNWKTHTKRRLSLGILGEKLRAPLHCNIALMVRGDSGAVLNWAPNDDETC